MHPGIQFVDKQPILTIFSTARHCTVLTSSKLLVHGSLGLFYDIMVVLKIQSVISIVI
jgi:hypothetical protein